MINKDYRTDMKASNFDIKNIYRISEDKKTVFIDIDLEFYREIYNVWDFSPAANRDLDGDLLDYLKGCAEEIPLKYKISIIFHLPSSIQNSDKEQKSILAYRNYFNYRIRRIKVSHASQRNSIIAYFFIGVFCIFSSIMIGRYFNENVFGIFISEGLTIGSWVVFWELFYFLFFTRSEHKKEERLLKRLSCGKIEYEYR